MAEEVVWKRALLQPSALIKDAIQVLSEASLRIVLIVDENLKLIGTITDGDIRRGLLKGSTINSKISEVINQKPTVVPKGIPKAEVLRIMGANKLFQIPVVAEDSRLVDLHVWDELSSPISRDNTILIMAGGKGTRLLPKTEKTPKPMLHLGGKPILQHIIERAKSEGFNRFILAIHHLGEVIEEYFGDGESLGVNISYVREKTPLGTAGALSLIDPKPSEPIIVTNGDVLTEVRYGDLLDFHVQNNAKATMAVQVHEVKIPYGVVQTKGVSLTGFEEKPTQAFLINAGVYAIDPACFVFLQEGREMNMPDLFETLIGQNLPTLAYLIHESWIDIGGHEEFTTAAKKLATLGEKHSESN
jgi:dTDP-glucose pyrophosphorylase